MVLFSSFHPHIKWFQGNATVTLTVQLMKPAMQKCEFFLDKVVYRSVNYLIQKNQTFLPKNLIKHIWYFLWNDQIFAAIRVNILH